MLGKWSGNLIKCKRKQCLENSIWTDSIKFIII